MNHWQNEFIAEYHRQEILQAAQDIHLEKMAVPSRVYHPGAFDRAMFNVANWMIATGKQLRKRYEVPAACCSKAPTRSLAH